MFFIYSTHGACVHTYSIYKHDLPALLKYILLKRKIHTHTHTLLEGRNDLLNATHKYLLTGHIISKSGLTMEVSRLNVLPSLGTSVLGSICEGNENGSECRLVNSLPVQGSLWFGATTGTLGIDRGSHDSPRRLEGTGGSLSLDGQSPGVQGKGRL